MLILGPRVYPSSDHLEHKTCVRRQREDYGIARRANAILLLNNGASCARIAKVLYLDDDTIRGWYKSYRKDGWDALAFDGWKGGQSRMKPAQEGALCAWLEAHFCRSTVEIRACVAAECGMTYSIEWADRLALGPVARVMHSDHSHRSGGSHQHPKPDPNPLHCNRGRNVDVLGQQ